MNASVNTLSSIESPDAAKGGCPVCGSSEQTDFFNVDGAPVHVGLAWNTRQEALQAPTGDVALTYCHGCGFIHNRLFDASIMSYEPGYEASLVHSQVFMSFLEGVATRLVGRFDLRNKTVLEIGCGAGHFLRMLCEQGANEGIGIDPSSAIKGADETDGQNVRYYRDFFSERHANLPVDFVCCLSALEHIPNPAATIRNVRRLVEGRNAPVYFEVFNAANAFKKRETWSIHYEQCNYFTLNSFPGLFTRCGFRVLEAAECYQGSQYLRVDAVADENGESLQQSKGSAKLPTELADFSRAYDAALEKWKGRFDRYRETNKRVVVWGTGGKGINFMNALESADVIAHAVEINPARQGKFVPGSGQKIEPPEFLATYQPDVIVITNALYEREMKQQAADMGVHCEFHIA